MTITLITIVNKIFYNIVLQTTRKDTHILFEQTDRKTFTKEISVIAPALTAKGQNTKLVTSLSLVTL